MQKTVIGRSRSPKESASIPSVKHPSARRESADFLFGIGLITAALLLCFPMLEGSQTADLSEAIPVMSGAVEEFPEETEGNKTTDRMKPEKIDDLAKPERSASASVSDSFYDRIGAYFAELIFGTSE